MSDEQPLLTTAEAAERAGVSVRVIRDAISKQELVAVRGKARSWNVSEESLSGWIESRAGSPNGAEAKAAPAGAQTYTPPEPDSVVISDERPFVLHHGFDGWLDVRDLESSPAPDGTHVVTLDPSALEGRREVNFTRYYPDESRWEGQDHAVMISA